MKRFALVGIMMCIGLSVDASQIPSRQVDKLNNAQIIPNAPNGLPQNIEKALHAAQLNQSDVSLVVMPLDGQMPILNHLGDIPRIPASTQKLVTTAIALDVLGAKFVWHNAIYYKGVIVGDTLYGDILLAGSGDPSLTHERLSALFEALSKKIKHIKGDIIIDTSAFGNVGYNPDAFDGQGWRAYNAEPSAFLVNFGTVEIRFTPKANAMIQIPMPAPSQPSEELGAPKNENMSNYHHTQVQILPSLANFAIPTTMATDNASCQLPVVQLNTSGVVLSGRFGALCGEQRVWRNFKDNNALAIKSVQAAWHSIDKTFAGEVRIGGDKRQFYAMPLITVPSRPLSEQIWQINQFSNNVMTEQVALSLPIYAGTMRQSNYPAAHAFIDKWWARLNAPAPTITRASGLCRECQITPNAMIALLKYVKTSSEFEVFLKSLPIAGQTGTMKALAKRNPNNPAIGRAWIKTGTLNDVTSMAGYVQGVGGRWYAVAGFINAKDVGYNAKAVAVLDEMLAWTAQDGQLLAMNH